MPRIGLDLFLSTALICYLSTFFKFIIVYIFNMRIDKIIIIIIIIIITIIIINTIIINVVTIIIIINIIHWYRLFVSDNVVSFGTKPFL